MPSKLNSEDFRNFLPTDEATDIPVVYIHVRRKFGPRVQVILWNLEKVHPILFEKICSISHLPKFLFSEGVQNKRVFL